MYKLYDIDIVIDCVYDSDKSVIFPMFVGEIPTHYLMIQSD